MVQGGKSVKVLFIGGTGTISSACARAVVAAGHSLAVYVRGTRDHRIPDGVDVIHGDINNQVNVDRIASHWNVVVDWVAYEEAHVERDVAIFDCDHYVLISSIAVYGVPKKLPLTEEGEFGQSLWHYALGKRACEKRIGALDFPFTIIRPGHTYAPFAVPSAIQGTGARLFAAMMSGESVLLHDSGESIWSMLHADDFAKVFMAIIGSREAIGQTYNIVNPEHLAWRDIYETMASALGVRIKLKFKPSREFAEEIRPTLLYSKAHDHVWNIAKVKALGDFTFTPFADGINECVRYFRNGCI